MFLISFIIRTVIADESRKNIGCLPSKSSRKRSAQKFKNYKSIENNYQNILFSISDTGVQPELLGINLR
jgi:hypothetical protein